MKSRQFTRVITALMCVLTVMMIIPITAGADTGPKPSVRVTFENLGDELCYATLLSSKESTGPFSVWDGTEEDARHNENEDYTYMPFGYDVWKAFAEYEDSDGFYFLQEAWQINNTKELAWTYYPPGEFKILLYFPETGNFAVSGVCERYAFDSYFTVDMDANLSVDYNEELSTNERLDAYKSYNYRVEAASLAARIVITVLIEMAIALLFGYRAKKQLLLLAGVNGGTQILLNVLLNIINYTSGQMAFVAFYILCELIVFVIEAILFYHLLNKFSVKQKPKWLAVIYALIANAASFGAGMLISVWMPGIF